MKNQTCPQISLKESIGRDASNNLTKYKGVVNISEHTYSMLRWGPDVGEHTHGAPAPIFNPSFEWELPVILHMPLHIKRIISHLFTGNKCTTRNRLNNQTNDLLIAVIRYSTTINLKKGTCLHIHLTSRWRSNKCVNRMKLQASHKACTKNKMPFKIDNEICLSLFSKNETSQMSLAMEASKLNSEPQLQRLVKKSNTVSGKTRS